MIHIYGQRKMLTDAFVVGTAEDLLSLARACEDAAKSQSGLGLVAKLVIGNGSPFDICVIRDEGGKACMHRLPYPYPGESKTASGDRPVDPEKFWEERGGKQLGEAQVPSPEKTEDPGPADALKKLEAASKEAGLPKDVRRKIAIELENVRTGKPWDVDFVKGLDA